MSQDQDIRLPNDDSPYWDFSSTYIESTLQDISKKRESVVIFIDGKQSFLSIFYHVLHDKKIVLIDYPMDSDLKDKIASSRFFVAKTFINKVEIVFPIERITEEKHNGGAWLGFEFPKKIHKLQRREFHRVHLPTTQTNICSIDGENFQSNEAITMRVSDISLGGICLLNSNETSILSVKDEYSKCKIHLEGYSDMVVDLLLKNVRNELDYRNHMKMFFGFKFKKLSPAQEREINKTILSIERQRKTLSDL